MSINDPLMYKLIVKEYDKPGMEVHVCNPCYSGGRGRRMLSLRTVLAKLVRS
jgi:hypothetical protein